MYAYNHFISLNIRFQMKPEKQVEVNIGGILVQVSPKYNAIVYLSLCSGVPFLCDGVSNLVLSKLQIFTYQSLKSLRLKIVHSRTLSNQVEIPILPLTSCVNWDQIFFICSFIIQHHFCIKVINKCYYDIS